MPADLTAAALIALLREHPGACGMLGIVHDPKFDSRLECHEARMRLWSGDGRIIASNFRRWLTGAAVEAHIERELPFPTQWCDLTWSSGEDAGKEPLCEWTKHPTFLHALLAGLESHAKETT